MDETISSLTDFVVAESIIFVLIILGFYILYLKQEQKYKNLQKEYARTLSDVKYYRRLYNDTKEVKNWMK